jgi:hypothetical protein
MTEAVFFNSQERTSMKNAIAATLVTTILLTGCGSKTDANEKNFGAAIKQYLDKKGELCLNLTRWPIDISQDDLRRQKGFQPGTAGTMAALEAVGLTKGTDTDVQAKSFDGRPNGVTFKVKRYTLTDAAKPYERQKEASSIGLNGRTTELRTDLCWGKKVLDKVVKWEGPMKFGDYQEARVKYQYQIDGLADWVRKPEFLAAFPYVGKLIEGAGKDEQQHGVKLTSQGWEPVGLDN